jgi:hypothetical protein
VGHQEHCIIGGRSRPNHHQRGISRSRLRESSFGSPPAIGKFQGAIAMSNLGGGVYLAINGDYATTYSSYDTISQSFSSAGNQIFSGAGCNQTNLTDQISCLRSFPALKLVGLSTVARYVVQDGHYINTEELNLRSRNPGTAHDPVIFGIADNDGASFCTYPKTPRHYRARRYYGLTIALSEMNSSLNEA